MSTDDQSTDSSGQLHAIRQWAEAEGHVLVDPEADEGVSGAHGPDKRPGLARALARCSGQAKRSPARIHGLVAYDRSRFSRDARLSGHLAWLAEQGGFRLLSVDGLDSADDSDQAAIHEAVQGAFGQMARKAIGRATKRALAMRKATGRVYGHPPYGMRRAGDRLESEPAEQRTIAEARRLRDSGLGLGRIAAALTEQGRLNRAGKPFGKGSVAGMLGG